MPSNPDDFEDEPEAPKPILPWITGIEAFTRYAKTAAQLKELVKHKKVRAKNVNGKQVFSVEDLEALPDSGDNTAEASMADLVRAATSQLAAQQAHDERMFDKYMAAFDKVLDSSSAAVEKANAHIIELEKQALDMRIATEKVFNLEHERKLSELREERTRTMQAKALEMVQKTLAPWIVTKLGGSIPGMSPSAGVNGESAAVDPRLSNLGQAVVGMVATMTDENFEKLGEIIPSDEYAVLTAIRAGVKE